MKTFPLAVPLGLCCAGFLAGFAGKRMTAASGAGSAVAAQNGEKTGANAVVERKISDRGASPAGSRQVAAGGKISLPTLHSTDTVATLLALDDAEAYARVATWMTGASEADVATYWDGLKDKPNASNDLIDLTFLNWSRLNPQGAIDAVKDGRYNHYAWWAWAAHDPQAAFDAALAANPDRVNNVAWGIGEFHPEWLRAHFKDIPESAVGNAMRGFGKWGDQSDPLAMLQFFKSNGMPVDQKTLKALISKDPLSAYDWLKENGEPDRNTYYYDGQPAKGSMAQTLDSLAATQPDVLKRMEEQEPAGETKRKMDAALFSQLLESDPDTALEQAKATKSPRVAAERLAAVGNNLLKNDPEKVYDVVNSIFTAYPGALEGMVWVLDANGRGSGSGTPTPGIKDLMDQLMTTDPGRVMNLPGLRESDGPFSSPPLNSLLQDWAARDLDAYLEWAQQKSDPAIRPQAEAAAVSTLSNFGRFQEAADLASTFGPDSGTVMNVLPSWALKDPEAATAWLDAAAIPAEKKQDLRASMESIIKQSAAQQSNP